MSLETPILGDEPAVHMYRILLSLTLIPFFLYSSFSFVLEFLLLCR